MIKILCKRCPDSKLQGCSVCGGFGYILEQLHCSCGETYWMRPHAITTYDGKVARSFDGLEITYHLKSGVTCEKCTVKL